mgnify:CR=1 FL=1
MGNPVFLNVADVHDSKTRSYNMSKIKGKDTRPEMIVRRFLWANGFRYRLHDKRLPGKPDIVLKKYRTVILVHGCFWHGHQGCKYFKWPSTRTEWWKAKIQRTIEKDKEDIEALGKLGWRVIVVWECGLKGKEMGPTLVHLIGEILNDYP